MPEINFDHIFDFQRYSTGPMTLSDGDVITVICLGTTVSQAQKDLKNPVEIVQENGKLTKRYK